MATIPAFLSVGTAGMVSRRYFSRVSVLYCSSFLSLWTLIMALGTWGLALSFDSHISLLIAVLALIWLALSAFMILRRYTASILCSVLVIGAYGAAASHAYDNAHTNWPISFVTLLVLLPCIWAIITLLYSLSMSLLMARQAERARRKDNPIAFTDVSSNAASLFMKTLARKKPDNMRRLGERIV